jgi:hypothetical protein
MKPELEEVLQHYGVKGMKWGKHIKSAGSSAKSGVKKVGTKTKEAADKVASKAKPHIDSIKRENSWKKQLNNASNMSTKQLQKVANRAQLENDLKRLSRKSNVGSSKDKKDYLKRGKMDDAELSRKVQRLRAKDNLLRNSNDATKAQKELAKKIIKVAAPLAISLAVNGKISQKDIFEAVTNPGGSKSKAVKAVIKTVSSKVKQSADLEDVILHGVDFNDLIGMLNHGYSDDDIVEFELLDDSLQHYGVKGMKWGVIRNKVQKSVKAHVKKRNAKERATLDKYHEKRINKSKSYKQAYNRRTKGEKGKTPARHYAAVRSIKAQNDKVKRAVILKTAALAAPLVMDKGRKLASKASDFASNPDNIRKGKNIIQAIKRSPIRYVDGKKMTNVVGTI